jgi:hypothetical protein
VAVLVPSLWEFSDGVDSGPGLVPLTPAAVTEPARATTARAEWNSILAGLLTLALAGSVLAAGQRRKGRSANSGMEHRRQVQAPDRRR